MSRRRIRTLKPEFFGDEKVVLLPRDARYTMVGIITLADDRGRLRDRPLEILGAIYPEEDVSTGQLRKWVAAIVKVGLALRYEVDGCFYLWLPRFLRHQVVEKPTESTLPAHPEDETAHLEIEEAYRLAKGKPPRKVSERSESNRRDVGEASIPPRASLPFPSVPSSTTSSQGPPEITRELIDEALAILAAVDRWEPDEIAVANAAAMYPTVDPLQGCRLAVTWAQDPTWEVESCSATLRAALRKLDGESKPKPETGVNREKRERRSRRGAALESMMAGGEA